MAFQTISAAANGNSTVIESGYGADLLISEAGTEVFHIASVEASSRASQDTIAGFGAGNLVSFSGIALQGDNAPATLHWAGVEPDDGKAYGVWQWADGTLRADINGDSTADISIDMQGRLLSAADLVFAPVIPTEPEPSARLVESGSGADRLVGEVGADIFHIGAVEASALGSQDTIAGFGADDLVSFNGIALQGDNTPATLHWAGVEPDGGKAYGVWQWTDGTLRADINGDSAADISIDMQGVLLSTASFDFGAGSNIPSQPEVPAEPEVPSQPEVPKRPDLPATQPSWVESFDNGTGMLSRVWGPGIDLSIPGQLTITSTPDNQDSGAMVPPWGPPDSGFGFGLYSFTLSMSQGDAPGPYALLWPSTDVWPGPELDLVELLPGGQAYSTIHWKGDAGENAFTSYNLSNVDATEVHTYSMMWEQGRLTGFVDGQEMWTTTDNVPNDYAHGGENSAPGIGMQTWWSTDAQHGTGYDNTITVYEMSYSAIA